MALDWIVTVFVAASATLSAALYRHSGRRYAEGKSDALASATGFRWVYRYLQITTIAASVGPRWSESPLWLAAFRSDTVTVIGLVVASAGMVLFAWAKVSLGQAYSPCFDSLAPLSVVTVGPYSRIRHPIYTGNLALVFGLFLASGSLWLAFNAVVLFGYYLRAAVTEERELSERFPEYAKRVARTGRFLPKGM